MVALGGHLYVYGGVRVKPDGADTILSDVIRARAQGGVVNQPWKRLAIGKSAPSKTIPCSCFTKFRSNSAWHRAWSCGCGWGCNPLPCAVTSGRLPSRRVPAVSMVPCVFGHESPEGRLSLLLFGGMRIKADTTDE